MRKTTKTHLPPTPDRQNTPDFFYMKIKGNFCSQVSGLWEKVRKKKKMKLVHSGIANTGGCELHLKGQGNSMKRSAMLNNSVQARDSDHDYFTEV